MLEFCLHKASGDDYDRVAGVIKPWEAVKTEAVQGKRLTMFAMQATERFKTHSGAVLAEAISMAIEKFGTKHGLTYTKVFALSNRKI